MYVAHSFYDNRRETRTDAKLVQVKQFYTNYLTTLRHERTKQTSGMALLAKFYFPEVAYLQTFI